jgi:hypothetical protein
MEVHRLQEKLAHTEREIPSIRADKFERAGALYPVFSNSLVGRVKQNLKAVLKMFHYDFQMTWGEVLSWLSLAFNTTVIGSHKSTPDKLFLGRELKCPLHVR